MLRLKKKIMHGRFAAFIPPVTVVVLLGRSLGEE